MALSDIQNGIAEDLKRRILSARREQAELKAEHGEILRGKEDSLRSLSRVQGSYRREQGLLSKLEGQKRWLNGQRERIERENSALEEGLAKGLLHLRSIISRRQGLRDEFNALLQKQIRYEARRVQVAGDLSGEKEARRKLEADIGSLVDNKKAQDLYLDSLSGWW